MPYHENPDLIWSSILENRNHISRLQVQVMELRHRMGDVEKRQRRLRDWPAWTEIMTPAQWAIVIILTSTTLLGITSPRQILDHFIGEPTEQH